jgi:hypothetical protein
LVLQQKIANLYASEEFLLGGIEAEGASDNSGLG